MTCTTHHHACDCREAEFAARDARMQKLEAVADAARELVAFMDKDEELMKALAALDARAEGDEK